MIWHIGDFWTHRAKIAQLISCLDCVTLQAEEIMLTIGQAFDLAFRPSSDHVLIVLQAEEITLTIGQAFDLAYRRFLDTQGKDMEQKKHHVLLQKKVGTVNSLNFQTPENFAVIYLKFKQRGQTLGYLVKKMQME